MIVAFDLETTGLDEEGKIIEIALIKFDAHTFQIVDSLSTLVNPHIPLPPECRHVTGITDEAVISAPDWDDTIQKQIFDFIGDFPLLAHNAEFDVGMLERHGIDVSKNIILDTFELARMLYLDAVSLNLGVLCDILGIEIGQAHRAYDDTVATVQIFQKCAEKITALPTPQKNALGFLWNRFDTAQSQWCCTYFGLGNTLSQTDFQDMMREELSVAISPSSPVSPSIPQRSFPEWYEHIFGNILTPQEKELAEQFFATMDEKVWFRIGNMTLFPEILATCFAVSSQQKQAPFVVVTNDMGRYASVLRVISEHIPVSFSICLQSSAYISLENFFSALFSQEHIVFSELIFFSKLTLWLFETKTGNLDELSWYPQEGNLKVLVSSVFRENGQDTRQENADILLVTPAYYFREYTGQSRHIFFTDGHLLEDEIYDAFQQKIEVQAMCDLSLQLEQYGQYAPIAQHISTQLHGLQALFEEYIHATQDDVDSVNVCIGTLWDTVKNILFYCRQELSSILPTELPLLVAFQLKNTLHILSRFCETERKTWELILRKYEEKHTLFLTPLSVSPILCPLWTSSQHVGIFSPVGEYSNTFLKNRLGISEFVSVDISADSLQTIIVPTDIGKNDFQQKITFLVALLEYYPGKLCIVTASKVESQAVFSALLEQKEEKTWKLFAQGVSGGQQKVFFEFARTQGPAVLIGTPDFFKNFPDQSEQIAVAWFRFRFAHPLDPFFLTHSQHCENNFMEYSLPKAIIQGYTLYASLLEKREKILTLVLDHRIDSRTYGEELQQIFGQKVIVKHTNTADFLEVLHKRYSAPEI